MRLLYTKEMVNVEVMVKFLEICNFSSLNPEEIEKLNKLVTSSDITFLIKIE